MQMIKHKNQNKRQKLQKKKCTKETGKETKENDKKSIYSWYFKKVPTVYATL